RPRVRRSVPAPLARPEPPPRLLASAGADPRGRPRPRDRREQLPRAPPRGARGPGTRAARGEPDRALAVPPAPRDPRVVRRARRRGRGVQPAHARPAPRPPGRVGDRAG